MLAQESGLSSLKIRVVFQCGQMELTASDIQSLAPGAILPLERSVQDMVDIVANGKRIGSGELVKAGDKLAVRVIRLFEDA